MKRYLLIVLAIILVLCTVKVLDWWIEDQQDSALEAMEKITLESLTDVNTDNFGQVPVETFVAAINHAAANEISEEKALSSGFKDDPWYWRVLAYPELKDFAGAASREVRLELCCSPAEEIVKIKLNCDGNLDEAYVKDAELYRLVRYKDDMQTEIDEEAFAKFEDVLVPWMEAHKTKMESNVDYAYQEYTLVNFWLMTRYEEANGAVAELYAFDYGLVPAVPADEILWAGGMRLDGDGRIRQFNGAGPVAVRYRSGERVVVSLPGEDFPYEAADFAEGSRQAEARDFLSSHLDWAETTESSINFR